MPGAQVGRRVRKHGGNRTVDGAAQAGVPVTNRRADQGVAEYGAAADETNRPIASASASSSIAQPNSAAPVRWRRDRRRRRGDQQGPPRGLGQRRHPAAECPSEASGTETALGWQPAMGSGLLRQFQQGKRIARGRLVQAADVARPVAAPCDHADAASASSPVSSSVGSPAVYRRASGRAATRSPARSGRPPGDERRSEGSRRWRDPPGARRRRAAAGTVLRASAEQTRRRPRPRIVPAGTAAQHQGDPERVAQLLRQLSIMPNGQQKLMEPGEPSRSRLASRRPQDPHLIGIPAVSASSAVLPIPASPRRRARRSAAPVRRRPASRCAAARVRGRPASVDRRRETRGDRIRRGPQRCDGAVRNAWRREPHEQHDYVARDGGRPGKTHGIRFKAVEEVGAVLNGALVVMGDRLGYYRSLAESGRAQPPNWPNAPAPISTTPANGSMPRPPGRSSPTTRRPVGTSCRRTRRRVTDETAPRSSADCSRSRTERLRLGPHLMRRAPATAWAGATTTRTCTWDASASSPRPTTPIWSLTGCRPRRRRRKAPRRSQGRRHRCGHGASTILMAKPSRGSRVRGTDAHSGSIATARARAEGAGLDTIDSETADADGPPAAPMTW